ncbi:hypothetical protein CDAR_209801 [Caerostris darwini]|uniref:Uncharacterized protein n=1 Tax=Caerostris darwini TaxID=1538125 RepID=A0AAV4T0X9_9ARAC|nr:hypothetical protein CDAR_209801 [Caerostris darwini]
MDRERTFEEDLKNFVHMIAFFMGVKIVMDCFDVGIFDAAVVVIVGIVINRVLYYAWNKLLVIWRRMMLTSKKCLSTTMKFIFVIFDFKIFGDRRTNLINRFGTMEVKMLDCVWESHSLILDIIIDSWRSYVALKRLVAGLIIFMLVETFLVAVCFYGSFETVTTTMFTKLFLILRTISKVCRKLWILTKIFIEIVIFTVIECFFLALYASGFFGIIAMVVIAVELYKYVQRKI